MSISCAICTDVIEGKPRYEPLGTDDAMVPVCTPCATEPVVPKEIIPTRCLRREAPNPRAAQIREHRNALKAQGLCVNGASHGAISRGRLCERCHAREKALNARRTARQR